jgi:DNA-binding protein
MTKADVIIAEFGKLADLTDWSFAKGCEEFKFNAKGNEVGVAKEIYDQIKTRLEAKSINIKSVKIALRVGEFKKEVMVAFQVD